jgi:riboflavin kinase/FMN adenylyltransferase
MSQTHRDLEPRGSVVAIGAFDGVHRGHRALLDRVRQRAHETGQESIALCFEPLPRQYFMGRNRIARLSSPREREEALRKLVARVHVMRFDEHLASTPAELFVRDVLVRELNAKEVWIGPEFRFGHGRQGDFNLLQSLGQQCGFEAHQVDPAVDGERISATRIRGSLSDGDFVAASRLLGRPYSMSGRVVHGRRLGRKLGYPTANLPIRWGAPPVLGIFAVKVRGEGLDHVHGGVASLGYRPTVTGASGPDQHDAGGAGVVEPLLEAHLFDFDGDLYGRRLEVEFLAKLRDEAKFDSLDALTTQMHRDAAEARRIIAATHSQPETTS